MCDYSEYSIVGPEHCVFVPRLTQEQFNSFNQAKCQETTLGFRTPQTTWEFTNAYYANSYYIKTIAIINIHGPVNQSELSEPFAEIVIWRWKDFKLDILKKELVERNEIKNNICLTQQDIVAKVFFTIRLIEKRKPLKDLCPALDYLPSDDGFSISVGKQHFVVSAQRLMQVSPVFRAMLTDEMREKATRKVDVKDTEPEHFRAFLEVIDPDQNVHPNPSNVVGVLKLADRYQVNLAKDRCEMHLMNCVEMPLIERLQLADAYGLNKLKRQNGESESTSTSKNYLIKPHLLNMAIGLSPHGCMKLNVLYKGNDRKSGASILSIGSMKLNVLYQANLDKFKKGQLSNAILQELTSRMCFNE